MTDLYTFFQYFYYFNGYSILSITRARGDAHTYRVLIEILKEGSAKKKLIQINDFRDNFFQLKNGWH